MGKFGGVLCCVLALGGAIALRTATLLAQTGAGRLTIQLTNLVEQPVVDYDRVEVAVCPPEGGTFTVPVICYSGPAVVLGVGDCGTNALRIESSRDLLTWAPFPQPGFQLTLGTNSTAVIPMTASNRFFRAAWD